MYELLELSIKISREITTSKIGITIGSGTYDILKITFIYLREKYYIKKLKDHKKKLNSNIERKEKLLRIIEKEIEEELKRIEKLNGKI